MKALYFTATWCQPCKVFGPIMEKLKDAVEVEKVDIEHDGDIIMAYNIMSVPTVVFLDDDRNEIGRFIGARTEEWVRDFIKEME